MAIVLTAQWYNQLIDKMIFRRFVFTLFIVFIIDPCNSKCKMVSSMKHGTLFLSKGEKPNSKCIRNLIFKSKETGKSFCLDKKRRKNDKLTCEGCFCGQENKPQLKNKVEEVGEVGVIGGSMVGENQYPWYAMILANAGLYMKKCKET